MKSLRQLLLLVLYSLIVCLACKSPSKEQAGDTASAPSVGAGKAAVKVELAPFERFSDDYKFPLIFRFSSAVAPANRRAAENFANLSVSPKRYVEWSWTSDSTLSMKPLDRWVAGSKINVSLAGLLTTDGTTAGQVDFYPKQFDLVLPEPAVSIFSCEMVVQSQAPLVQYPQIKYNFNYQLSDKLTQLTPYVSLKAHTEQSNKSEDLGVSFSNSIATGPSISRPTEKMDIVFEIKQGMPFLLGGRLKEGASCVIKLDPLSWDKVADDLLKSAAKNKPLVSPHVYPPQMGALYRGNGREPITLSFLNNSSAYSGNQQEHGKAKGITLDKGIQISPTMPGKWKTSENDINTIFFTPDNPWPLDQTYTVTVDKESFPTLEFKDASANFNTPKFEMEFSKIKLNSNFEKPEIRQVVGHLSLSHKTDLEKFQKDLRVRKIFYRSQPSSKKLDKFEQDLPFTLAEDPKDPQTVYLTTERFLILPEAQTVEIGYGGTYSSASASSISVPVPALGEIFKVMAASTEVVSKNSNVLERILSVEFSEKTDPTKLQSELKLYLLPDCSLKENSKACRNRPAFEDSDLVFKEVLAAAPEVPLTMLPQTEASSPLVFNFSYDAPDNREVYLKISNSLTSKDNFPLSKTYSKVFRIAPLPKTLKIMHDGALLSASGDKALGITARGVKKISYSLARVLPQDVAHLVSLMDGDLKQPYLSNWQIGLNQLAEHFRYQETLPMVDPGKTLYSSVDFNRFLSKGKSPRGLFVLSLKEFKPENENQNEETNTACQSSSAQVGGFAQDGNYISDDNSSPDCSGNETGAGTELSDSRLVLITDLGLLVKDGVNGEHSVYVMSFRSGQPVAGAEVKLLGQNGLPVFTQQSNQQGMVVFPKTTDLKDEKQPLLYTVEKDGDYSFLPFEKGNRELNFSRFDTSGVYNTEETEGLRAMIFTDRGIYRPGEESRFGIIVRKRNLEAAVANLPLEIRISDPRGVEILRKKYALSSSGLSDFRFKSENPLSGTYNLGVYLVRGSDFSKQFLLGSTNFRIEDFQPDKLVVQARYESPEAKEGGKAWENLNGKFQVKVQNLFGSAAIGNRVKARLLLNPWIGLFSEFPDFSFYSRESEASLNEQAEELGEQSTDENGLVSFATDLSRYKERALNMQFTAEAFEKESGRSVFASTNLLVSSAAYFLGWKADGSLSYIPKGDGRKLSLIAVDKTPAKVELKGLKASLEQISMISALIKQPDGTLSYQLTPKVSNVWSGELDVNTSLTEFALKTDEAGSFKLRVQDAQGEMLAVIPYTVHGEGNTTFMADRSAEVGITLSKTSVEPNEELEVSLNTPYVGAGLLTIERDKVYASKWFKVDSRASVQKIKIPEGIIGNAYVSVAFVRSLESRDIYASPLSYGTKPVFIAKSRYSSKIDLSVPERVKPGEAFEVKYKTSEKGQFLLYAVDEGILQFARYKNPDPLKSFVPKRALEVLTYQILDLLMPDQKIVKEQLSSTGGDEDVSLGKFKNPFARKRREPMAFWSGVIDDSGEGSIKVPVPEYFNGTIRLIALHLGERKLGVQIAKTVAQHDFVIEPQLPYFVSPGDEFEVGATVANMLRNSGPDVKLSVSVKPSSGFEVLGDSSVSLNVPENQDRAFRLRLRAKEVLGEQELSFTASALDKTVTMSDTISLRPPQPFKTTLRSGIYRPELPGASAENKFDALREIYAEKQEVLAQISSTPLTLASSLYTFLKSYPYGCTEQVVSQAFPGIALGVDPELGFNQKDVERSAKRALQILSSRQKADGSFGMWEPSGYGIPLYSIYAIHYLLEAQKAGMEVSEAVVNRSKEYLTSFSNEQLSANSDWDALAYALYLRALSGEQVPEQARQLKALMEAHGVNRNYWRRAEIFLAGAFKLMQLDKEAAELLPNPRKDNGILGNSWDPSDLAIYGYIAAKHFDSSHWLSPLDSSLAVARMLQLAKPSSINASFAILALKETMAKANADNSDKFKIAAKTPRGLAELALSGNRIRQSLLPAGATEVNYSGRQGEMYFYSLSESGFDRKPGAPYAEGLSVQRELRDEKGEKKDAFALNDKVDVTLFVKAEKDLKEVAVVELLPGGFELDLDNPEGLAGRRSLNPGENSWSPKFIEVQEDRVIFFGDLPADTRTFTYRLKPLNRGRYYFAAPYAEGMYETANKAQGAGSFVEIK